MALGRTQGRSLMEELGAAGSLQDLMEKGPLFRRRSHGGEWMFLTTELMWKHLSPSLANWCLEGFSCCCLDTLVLLWSGLVGTSLNGWGMKKLFSLFPWANSSLQGGSWAAAAAALVLIPWLCPQSPGVDPCVPPRMGLFLFHDHTVCSVVPNTALPSLSPPVNWAALEGAFSYFS